jgi:hypothetical protein
LVGTAATTAFTPAPPYSSPFHPALEGRTHHQTAKFIASMAKFIASLDQPAELFHGQTANSFAPPSLKPAAESNSSKSLEIRKRCFEKTQFP